MKTCTEKGEPEDSEGSGMKIPLDPNLTPRLVNAVIHNLFQKNIFIIQLNKVINGL